MAKRKRAISVDELLNTKFIEIPLTGRFRELLGRPEEGGTIFIKGQSGHGKTTFILQMCKEFSKFGKVLYNSLEEGARKSMQEAVKEQNLSADEKKKINFLHREAIPQMRKRLKKSRGVRFCVIDSIQYAFMTAKEYKEMQAENPKIKFIINSHVLGKNAVGSLARYIEYDADQKITVEGFKAFSKSRSSRGKLTTPYIIWHEGAEDYWNDLKL